MTQDQLTAAMAFAANQGAQSSTVYVVKLADGTLKQVANVDFVQYEANCYPSQVPAGAAVVIITPAS